jgi:hypothetical protein
MLSLALVPRSDGIRHCAFHVFAKKGNEDNKTSNPTMWNLALLLPCGTVLQNTSSPLPHEIFYFILF